MTKIKVYREIEISLNDANGYFEAKIEKQEFSQSTLADIQGKIDTYLKNQAVKLREKLAIAAITDAGKAVTITGIHARLGSITSTPEAKDGKYCGSPEFYPDCAYARRLLKDLKGAQALVAQFTDALKKIEIKVNHSYRRELKGDEYETLMAELKRNAATCLKRAQDARTLSEVAAEEIARG